MVTNACSAHSNVKILWIVGFDVLVSRFVFQNFVIYVVHYRFLNQCCKIYSLRNINYSILISFYYVIHSNIRVYEINGHLQSELKSKVVLSTLW